MSRFDRTYLIFMGSLMGGAESVTTRHAELVSKSTYSVHLGLDNPNKNYVRSLRRLVRTIYEVRKVQKSSQCRVAIFTTHSKLNIFICACKSLKLFNQNTVVVARESTVIFRRLSGWRRLARIVLYRTLMGQADVIICQTRGMANELGENLSNHAAEKVIVIRNTIDLETIYRLSREDVVPSTIVPLKYIFAVGRLIPEKGFDLLIRAFKQSALHKDYKLLIAGSGPELEKLQKTTELLCVESKVLFLGHVKNPYPLMSKCNLAVVSSRVEGFPNVLLEFMALSQQVVCTPCAEGISRIPCISVCLDASVDEIAKRMKFAIDNPSTLAERKKYLLANHSQELAKEFLSRALGV